MNGLPMEKLQVAAVLAFCCLAVVSPRQLCLRGDFNSQFHYILQNEMLSDEDIANVSHIIDDVSDTLNRKWPGTAVAPFGSMVSGLALKSSDIDFLATIPGYNEQIEKEIVQDVFDLLQEQPDLYEELTPRMAKVSLITFLHKPTQKYTDLSFRGPTGVANSQLLKYLMYSDPRIREITLFLKFWCETHGIISKGKLPSYALSLMSIFFFQQKGMLPPIMEMQRDAKPVYIQGFDHGFNTIPIQSSNNENVYDLLGGFFRYYRDFDFDNYFISTFMGRPVSKKDFSDIETIPAEFRTYKEKLRDNTVAPLPDTVVLVVQDAFEHGRNVAKNNVEVSASLISQIKRAAHLFDELPPNQVLRAILKKEKEFVQIKQLSVLDEISGDEHCVPDK